MMKFFKQGLLVMAVMTAGAAFAQTWTNISTPSRYLSSMASSADGTKLVATDGSFFTSTNSGATWTQTALINDLFLTDVASSADGTILIAAATPNGVGPGLYVSTNSGATWSTNGTPNVAVWLAVATSADGTKLVAAGSYTDPGLVRNPPGGVVYTSADSGNTWVSNSLPVVPPFWWSVASSADGNKLVVVSASGQICISTNAGATWQQPNSSPSTNNIWMSVASSADGSKLVAVSYYIDADVNWFGSIYTSTNSGMTWTSNNVPNKTWFSVASSADGTKLVAAGENGNGNGAEVCISTNGGNTWTVELKGGGPDGYSAFGTVVLSADGNRMYAIVGGGMGSGLGPISTADWPPSAVLNFAPSPTNLTLAWTVPSTNFTLQTSADLVSWAAITNPPVLNLTNLQNQVTLPSSGSGFFRLTTP
jgi:photosystem II stability/assembly factor-like uncharacterized protein